MRKGVGCRVIKHSWHLQFSWTLLKNRFSNICHYKRPVAFTNMEHLLPKAAYTVIMRTIRESPLKVDSKRQFISIVQVFKRKEFQSFHIFIQSFSSHMKYYLY